MRTTTREKALRLPRWLAPAASALVILAVGGGYVANAGATSPTVPSAPGSPTGYDAATVGTGLASPYAVADDNAGHVVVAVTGDSHIYVMNSDGSNEHAVGFGFSSPHGVAVDNSGHIFVADTGNGRVVEMNLDGTNLHTLGSGWVAPTGIALDNSGNLFVTDPTQVNALNRVQAITTAGRNQRNLGVTWASPAGIAADSAGHLFVGDTSTNKVYELNTDGSSEVAIGTGFTTPAGLDVDNLGHVFVADSSTKVITEMNVDGNNEHVVSATLGTPTGVAVDSRGHLYVADSTLTNLIEQSQDPSAYAENGSATLTWAAPSSNGGSAITSYSVTAVPTGGTSVTTTFPGNVTSGTVWGLTPTMTYFFTVSATNATGTSSPSWASNSVTPNAAVPAVMAAPAVTPNSMQVALTWVAPADGGSVLTGFVATASASGQPSVTTTFAPTATSGTVYGLTNGVAYTISITAINANGPGAPSPASAAFTPATAPSSPTSPVATAGTAQATVVFTASSFNGGSPITSYTVTSSPGAKTCVTGGTLTCTVNGLSNGVSYTFSVTATNAIGTSSPSAPSNAVIPIGPPTSPLSVHAVAGNTKVSVTWAAPASTGGSPVTGYTVTSSPGAKTCTTTGARTCIVSGLTNGHSYTFKVTAKNTVGSSAPSAPSNLVTPR